MFDFGTVVVSLNRNNGKLGTLVSQAEIAVWVRAPGALAAVLGYYPTKKI